MFRISTYFIIAALLFLAGCKAAAPEHTERYMLTVILIDDKRSVEKVMDACTELGLTNLEILQEPPVGMDRLMVTMKFTRSNDAVINKIRSELYSIKEVLNVMINKSF